MPSIFEVKWVEVDSVRGQPRFVFETANSPPMTCGAACMIIANTKFAVRLTGRYSLGDRRIERYNSAILEEAFLSLMTRYRKTTVPTAHDFVALRSFFSDCLLLAFINLMSASMSSISQMLTESMLGDHHTDAVAHIAYIAHTVQAVVEASVDT